MSRSGKKYCDDCCNRRWVKEHPCGRKLCTSCTDKEDMVYEPPVNIYTESTFKQETYQDLMDLKERQLQKAIDTLSFIDSMRNKPCPDDCTCVYDTAHFAVKDIKEME